MSPPGDRLAPSRRRNRPGVRRDRRGRGLRGVLVPAGVPLSRSRAELFDDMVLDAVEHLEDRWASKLDSVEFAVEDVPAVPDGPPEALVWGTDVIEDGAVPLARLLPAGSDPGGRPTPPRIVLYRRPLELRAIDRTELADLVHDVVVEQVANLLGLDPDEVDPPAE